MFIRGSKQQHNNMYRQVLIPDEQNYLISIPNYLYGCEIEVVMSPMSHETMTPKFKPRNSWAKAAKQMHQLGDDILIMPSMSNNENLDWWTWEE